jgi:hypothetical protein
MGLQCGAQTRVSVPKGFLSLYGGLCLALALMIFAWGTGYKLSLYKVVGGPCSAPAKVCTRGSDAAKSAATHLADGQDVAQTPVLVASLYSLDERAGSYPVDRQRGEAAMDLSPLRRAPILNLRPPPSQGRPLD